MAVEAIVRCRLARGSRFFCAVYIESMVGCQAAAMVHNPLIK